jgi:hypothetical protein
MWKSVIYKEWLKIKWVTLLFAIIGIFSVGNIFLKVQHDITFNGANNYIYNILFMGYQYFVYSFFRFVPAIGALVIAIAQYFPETVNKRIKLTFHLPLNENKVLIMMMAFGTISLLATFLSIFLLFIGLSVIYFPAEIVITAAISVLPWFLAGFTIYYMAALIILEPVWKFRFLYLIVAAAFIPVYYEPAASGAYAPAILILIVLTALLSISLLFSGYRFRKGEM